MVVPLIPNPNGPSVIPAVPLPTPNDVVPRHTTLASVTPRVFRGDLRDLPPARPWLPGDPIVERPNSTVSRGEATPAPAKSLRDGAAERAVGGGETRPPDGPPREVLPFTFSPPDLDLDDAADFTGARPPDPVGDVGRSHYIQIVNHPDGSQVIVFDKSGSVQAGPFTLASIALASTGPWTGAGNCGIGLGDPIVLYDRLADRWLMSEIADPNDTTPGGDLCVYVSRTSDPLTGGWYLYDFPTPRFPDYAKYGVWPDAYYVSTREAGAPAYALERAAMLAGLTAGWARETPPPVAELLRPFTPADLDGPQPPPAASPGFFMRHRDDELHPPDLPSMPDPASDALEIWEAGVTWSPPSLTFTGPMTVPVSEFDSRFCETPFGCLPQPVGSTLQAHETPVMWRLQYRNFGSHESLVGNLTTDVDPNPGTAAVHAGVRWFELRRSPPGAGTWTVFQEGTHAPDAENRWLGSIAMDGCGNMALGYTLASAVTNASIRYSGRLASDPLDTLPVPEFNVVTSAGVESSSRWGDYSSMNVDEVDQCTFWFTSEFLEVPNPDDPDFYLWGTRIVAFSFPECLAEQPGAEVPNTSLRVTKQAPNGVQLDWDPITPATTYNVFRGDIDSLFVSRAYNHTFSATGAGACNLGTNTYTDPNDQADPTDFYYLVTARSCGLEGATGTDSFGVQRPLGRGCP
jgi:hypothetical protein